MKKLGIWIIALLYTTTLYAGNIEIQAEKDINQLYHTLSEKKNTDLNQRIEFISQQFLDKPYLLGALGEGEKAHYDQFPLYRTDAFDCLTYVETVLALALAHDFQEFQTWMLKIRYAKEKAIYTERNHFTELDWNQHIQRLGLLKNITEQIGKSDTAVAKTVINKRGWYLKQPQTAIRLRVPVAETIQQRHQELVKKHRIFSEYPVSTAYLPLTLLFDEKQQPRMQYFNQIPQNAVVEIVRPDWHLKETIGTNLNISHIGFAVWKDNILYYRNASQLLGKVADIPMTDYLKNTLKSPTIRGINVQQIIITKKE